MIFPIRSEPLRKLVSDSFAKKRKVSSHFNDWIKECGENPVQALSKEVRDNLMRYSSVTASGAIVNRSKRVTSDLTNWIGRY